jgi:hypothetical protein
MDTKIHRTKIAPETFSANAAVGTMNLRRSYAAAPPVVFVGAKR